MRGTDDGTETTLAQRIESLRRSRAQDNQRPPSDAALAAEIAGVGENTLYKLRTGRISNPRMTTLAALAEAFDVSPGYLFPGPACDVTEHRELTAALGRADVRNLCRRLAHLSPQQLAAMHRLLDAS